MDRICEISREYVIGLISPRTYRSRMVAALSMLEDEDTDQLARAIIESKPNGQLNTLP